MNLDNARFIPGDMLYENEGGVEQAHRFEGGALAVAPYTHVELDAITTCVVTRSDGPTTIGSMQWRRGAG